MKNVMAVLTILALAGLAGIPRSGPLGIAGHALASVAGPEGTGTPTPGPTNPNGP